MCVNIACQPKSHISAVIKAVGMLCHFKQCSVFLAGGNIIVILIGLHAYIAALSVFIQSTKTNTFQNMLTLAVLSFSVVVAVVHKHLKFRPLPVRGVHFESIASRQST